MDAVVPTAAVRGANGLVTRGSISSGAIRGCPVVAPGVTVPLSLALARPLTLVRVTRSISSGEVMMVVSRR